MKNIKSQVENLKDDKLRYWRYNAKCRRVVKQSDNVVDIVCMNFVPECSIKKVSKNQYINIKKRIVEDFGEEKEIDCFGKIIKYKECKGYKEVYFTDGEVHEMCPKPEDKVGMRNKRALRKIFVDLRYLINTNFCVRDSRKQLFITLTYDTIMTDTKKLHDDFRKFIARLNRAFSENELLYIAIIEPQGNKSWHIHLLLKTLNQRDLYIHDSEIRKLWGHGITQTERLAADNIGSYFVAYMSNAPLDDDSDDIPDDDIEIRNSKRYIKGKRMEWYPEYMQIYRHSKNVKYPEKFEGQNMDSVIEHVESEFDVITYQGIREIETDKKTLKIAKEQRIKSKQ